MNKLGIILFFISLVFISCEKIEVPLEKKNTIDTIQVVKYDTTFGFYNNAKRIILLEDFTGHTCPNCPAAAVKAKELKNIYPDQLALIALHAGFFALPQTNADGSFKTDFRTPEGEEYVSPSGFAVQAYPAGMISRLKTGNNYIYDLLDWESKILEIKDLAPIFKINLLNLYNDSLKSLKTEIKIIKNFSISSNYKISVYLIEDDIIDWQVDGTSIKPTYQHDHVLRKVFNGTWGEEVNFTGDTASFTYQNAIAGNWNRTHCEVVAFVWDANTKEVFQVNAAHVGL